MLRARGDLTDAAAEFKLELARDPESEEAARQLDEVESALRRIIQAARQLGPYAAIELLLPGGSLLAIALWLYRRNRAARRTGGPQVA